MRWKSIHVYYYQPDKSGLLLNGVRPVFRDLRPFVDAVSVTRHWRLGPHLRLNFRTDDHTFEKLVWPTAERELSRYLTAEPSTTVLDIELHSREHRTLAELEAEKGPLSPWVPDNTVLRAEFDDRTEAMGSSRGAELLADFYADTTDLTFTAYETCSARPQLMSRAFDLMVATAHLGAAEGIARGFISFRSHAEGFLAQNADGVALRRHWDDNYRQTAESLRARVADIVEAIDHDREPDHRLAEWFLTIGRFRDRIQRALADGSLPIPPPPPPRPGAERRLEASDFHRRLFANPEWSRMQDSTDFTIYRLLLNFTYLHLTQLGLVPKDRILLCHMIANAVEDHFGVSATELVTHAQTRSPSHGG
ncbi:thiopeptide maturation pyridine synthase [Nocardia sp. NPDC055053]